MRITRWLDFILIYLALGLLLGLILVGSEGDFGRLLLGLLVALYVPGYLLSLAMFPHRDSIDMLERNAIAIGLSIVVIPILALLVHSLHLPLTLWPILLSEGIVIAIATAVGLVRRSQLEASAYTLRLERSHLYYVMALVGLTALSLYWIDSSQSAELFTEFYILGDGGMAQRYAYETGIETPITATIGIVNRETADQAYRLELWAVDPWQSRRELLLTESIAVDMGTVHEQPLSWHMPFIGQDQQVVLLLFQADQAEAEPYRSLRLWLDVAPTVINPPISAVDQTPIESNRTQAASIQRVAPTATPQPAPTSSPVAAAPTATSTAVPLSLSGLELIYPRINYFGGPVLVRGNADPLANLTVIGTGLTTSQTLTTTIGIDGAWERYIVLTEPGRHIIEVATENERVTAGNLYVPFDNQFAAPGDCESGLPAFGQIEGNAYVVADCESLHLIAHRLSISPDDLIAANPQFRNGRLLTIGTRLLIPANP